MKFSNLLLAGFLLSTLLFSACKKKGCTDANAENYSAKAKKDDGSCHYTYQITYEVKVLGSANGDNEISYYDPALGLLTKMGVVDKFTYSFAAVSDDVVWVEAKSFNATAGTSHVYTAIYVDGKLSDNCLDDSFAYSCKTEVTLL